MRLALHLDSGFNRIERKIFGRISFCKNPAFAGFFFTVNQNTDGFEYKKKNSFSILSNKDYYKLNAK